MPAVTLQDHLSQGHGGYSPRSSVEGCPRVTVGGVPVHCEGHAWAPHTSGGHTHDGYLASGAPHVTIAGRGVGRVGDPISCGDTVAQGCPRVTIGNCGGPGFGREMTFNSLTDPKDKLILCLPEMEAAEAERKDEINRRGWIYAHDSIVKWLSKSAYTIRDKMDNGGQDPLWVEWDWLMLYLRFEEAVSLMLWRSYLFSQAARALLIRHLNEDGAFTGSGNTFDHTALSWDKQRARAFQGKVMHTPVWLLSKNIDSRGKPDGLQVAIANVTIYALAQGRTERLPGGAWRIHVENVGLFIHDAFDFQDDQWLGNWECSEKNKGISLLDSARELPWEILGKELGLPSRLDNRTFRNFRERTGYGCDFRIMCQPHLVAIKDFSYDTV